MRRTRFITAVLLTFALSVAGCSDDSGNDDDFSDLDPGGDDNDSGGDGGNGGDGGGDGSGGDGSDGDGDGSDDGNDGGSSSGSTGGDGDVMSVWPLPDGDYEIVSPYQLIDDEFRVSEFVSVQTMSVSMDDVLDFYRDYFPAMGLMINEIPLGDSVAMNLTDPDDPMWSGVMQTGPTPDGYVVITHDYTDPKEQTEATTTTEPPADITSDDMGSVGEGAG